MKDVRVYDEEYDRLKELSDKYMLPISEIVEAMFTALDDAYMEEPWDEKNL